MEEGSYHLEELRPSASSPDLIQATYFLFHVSIIYRASRGYLFYLSFIIKNVFKICTTYGLGEVLGERGHQWRTEAWL
jgi:hypothetical protein